MGEQSRKQTIVAVVGAGPAGLMAAIAAARAGTRVTLCERMTRPGVKLLATGGGRCNITNTLTAAEIMASFGREGGFMRPALREMPPEGIRKFFAEAGVETHAPDGFHVFPRSESASDVLAALRRNCERLNVKMLTACAVRSLRLKDGGITGIEAGGGDTSGSGFIAADAVIMATGGRSYPELGSDGSGYRLARQAGHTVAEPVPALVPLVSRERWPRECAGITLSEARVWIDLPGLARAGRTGDLLFTHHGISGPAALDRSGEVSALLLKQNEVPVCIDIAPGTSETEWLARLDGWQKTEGRKMIRTLLDRHMPGTLAQVLCRLAGIDGDSRPAAITRPQRQALARMAKRLPLTITGTEGFSRALVTRGGVALDEVEPRSLQSRIVRGLFFAGEILNLDGPTGGYNLTWAFASGWLAGKSAATVKR